MSKVGSVNPQTMAAPERAKSMLESAFIRI